MAAITNSPTQQRAHSTSIEYKRTAVHDDWERMRVHMPSILPITTSASPDNIMQTSARTNANLITLPGILDMGRGVREHGAGGA